MDVKREQIFEEGVVNFDDQSTKILRKACELGGKLSFADCTELTSRPGIDIIELMIRLLPLAKMYSHPPVSDFFVGVVVLAEDLKNPGEPGLFFGGNIEFPGQALNQSIHGEQAATMNAWHSGFTKIVALAVNETPCGHCRQFLNEFSLGGDIQIVIPGRSPNAYQTSSLSELLPLSFGPTDLGSDRGLDHGPSHDQVLGLIDQLDDKVVLAALKAASQSYAPYTANRAGCAAMTAKGTIVTGSYIESVAYNPSLSPLQTVAIALNRCGLNPLEAVTRIVLVECVTSISQLDNAQLLAKSLAPGLEIEYHRAQ